MASKYETTAAAVVDNIGGKDNVKEAFHCITRLRFYVHDKSKVKLDAIRNLDNVIGAQFSGEQLQIVIGQDVADYYDQVIKLVGQDKATGSVAADDDDTTHAAHEEHEKFSLKSLFATLSAIFMPVVPALAGTGMLKGVSILITTYTKIPPTTGWLQVLNIASDCVFYFFPFLVAWSAARRFKTDIPLSLALAGTLLYPTMTEGLAAGKKGLDFLGLQVPFVKYASSSIPIILTVLLLSWMYPHINKLIPKALQLVFTPMIVMAIMVPVTLIAVAPLANYVSYGLAALVTWLFKVSPIIAGLIVGSTRPLVVLSGMHLSLGAVIVQNLATYGYDVLLPVNTMGTLAMVGAALGTWYKSKNEKTKQVSMSAFISAVIGITEPTIYGLLIKFRRVLVATMIGGGVAGAFVAAFKGTSSAYVNSSLLSLPVFAGRGFPFVVIGMVIAFVLAFVMVQILGVGEDSPVAVGAQAGTQTSDSGDSEVAGQKAETITGFTVKSPMNGELKALSNLKDDVFSSNMMGKGVAIVPDDQFVRAPVSGTIAVVAETKHAIGLKSDDGVEVLIHMGIDTFKLKGEPFNIHVKVGEKVEAGQLLAEVDFDSINAAGYDTTTPVIISNTKDFLDVIPLKESGHVSANEKLISVVPNK